MSGGRRSQTATQVINRVDSQLDEGSIHDGDNGADVNRVASHMGVDHGGGDRDDNGTTMEQNELKPSMRKATATFSIQGNE